MEKRLGYTTIIAMERAAGIVQTGAKGFWATKFIPRAAALQAYGNAATIVASGFWSYPVMRRFEYGVRRNMGERR